MNEHKEHKIIVTETVFSKISYKKPITFGEINIELQPEDEIFQHWEEPFEGSVEAWEGHWSCEVHRDRLETDEEFETRMANSKTEKERMKKRRYENYLKLKEEFENDSEVQS